MSGRDDHEDRSNEITNYFEEIDSLLSLSEEKQIWPDKNISYETFVLDMDKQISSKAPIVNLGGKENISKLISVISSYSLNEMKNASYASEMKKLITDESFNYMNCLNDSMIFWSFLKSCDDFRDLPWYYREYIGQKMIKNTVYITDIFQRRLFLEDKSQEDFEREQRIHIKIDEKYGYVDDILKKDMEVILLYFGETNSKAKLRAVTYKIYLRFILKFKKFLIIMFPNDKESLNDKEKLNSDKKRKALTMRRSRQTNYMSLKTTISEDTSVIGRSTSGARYRNDVELDQRLEDNSDDDSCASDYGSQELKSFKKLTERETDDEIKSQGSNESWKDDLCNFLKNSANNDMENNNCGDDAGSGDMWDFNHDQDHDISEQMEETFDDSFHLKNNGQNWVNNNSDENNILEQLDESLKDSDDLSLKSNIVETESDISDKINVFTSPSNIKHKDTKSCKGGFNIHFDCVEVQKLMDELSEETKQIILRFLYTANELTCAWKS